MKININRPREGDLQVRPHHRGVRASERGRMEGKKRKTTPNVYAQKKLFKYRAYNTKWLCMHCLSFMKFTPGLVV